MHPHRLCERHHLADGARSITRYRRLNTTKGRHHRITGSRHRFLGLEGRRRLDTRGPRLCIMRPRLRLATTLPMDRTVGSMTTGIMRRMSRDMIMATASTMMARGRQHHKGPPCP